MRAELEHELYLALFVTAFDAASSMTVEGVDLRDYDDDRRLELGEDPRGPELIALRGGFGGMRRVPGLPKVRGPGIGGDFESMHPRRPAGVEGAGEFTNKPEAASHQPHRGRRTGQGSRGGAESTTGERIGGGHAPVRRGATAGTVRGGGIGGAFPRMAGGAHLTIRHAEGNPLTHERLARAAYTAARAGRALHIVTPQGRRVMQPQRHQQGWNLRQWLHYIKAIFTRPLLQRPDWAKVNIGRPGWAKSQIQRPGWAKVNIQRPEWAQRLLTDGQADEEAILLRGGRGRSRRSSGEHIGGHFPGQGPGRTDADAHEIGTGKWAKTGRHAKATATNKGGQQGERGAQTRARIQAQADRLHARLINLRASLSRTETAMRADTQPGDYARVTTIGGRVLDGTGDHELRISAELQKRMGGMYLSIRHGDGAPPHAREVAFAAARQVRQLRVITPHARYVISPDRSGWTANRWNSEIGPAFARARRESAEGHHLTDEQILEHAVGYAGLRYRRIPWAQELSERQDVLILLWGFDWSAESETERG